MECYCDISVPNDDEFLLDDKNTQPLLKQNNCIRCKLISTEVIQNLDESDNAAIIWPNVNYRSRQYNGILPKFTDQTYSINSANDSIEGALLLNGLMNSNLPRDVVAHCHQEREIHNIKSARNKLLFTTSLCFLFMFAELIGGYIAGSIALMTDAAHMLTDVLACVMALAAIYIGKKKPTKRYTFGFYRAEVLGALFSVIFIWVLTVLFIYWAARRLYTNDYEIHSKTMLIIAGLGLIVNIIQVIILHGTFSHDHTESNINIRAALLHVLGDLLQSIGVVIAAIIIIYFPNMKYIDPICTFLFSILVLFTTRCVFRDSMNILMEGFPRTIKYNVLYKALRRIPNVKHVHKLHVWSLTTMRYNLSVHLAVEEQTNRDDILVAARKLLHDEFNINNSTIQVEIFDCETMAICPECKVPD